jgi:nickel superoxide dismutase
VHFAEMVSFSNLNQTKGEQTMKNFIKVMLLIAITVFGSILLLQQPVNAHCQIPCGIYDDHARVQSMIEDTATVEKSVRMINALAGKLEAQFQNQLVRWVINKEKHAQQIIATISDYFLTQRVEPSQKDYAQRLSKHHAVIIAAMKAKQNVEMQYVKNLKESIEAPLSYYPEHKQ